jgi:hypothetical protein
MQCVFDQFDQGLGDMADIGRIDSEGLILPEPEDIITHDADGWIRLMKLMSGMWKYYSETPDDRPRTVLMENMKGFETACFKQHCKTDYGANWDKFMTYSNGPKSAVADLWPQFLDYVNAYRSLGIHVIITGHTAVKDKKSPEYDHPMSIASTTTYLFDETIKDANLVMQIALDYEVSIKGQGDYRQVRASKDAKAKLVCQKSPIYGSCKNHYGITDEIIITGPPSQTYRDLAKEAKMDPATWTRIK